MTFRHYFKLRARARYWKRRALKAESELSEARESLNAECERNRYREDTFASATVMGSRNMYGLPPREGPAPVQARPPQVGKPTPQPLTAPLFSGSWDANHTWADKEEFKMEYLPAVDAGLVSLTKAQQDFAELVTSRRTPLNDEPFGAN